MKDRQLPPARPPKNRPAPPATDPALAAEVASHLGGIRREQWERTVPERFYDATLDDFIDHPAEPALLRWQRSWDAGTNLVIFGPVGVGKSHAAAAAVAEPYAREGASLVWLKGAQANVLLDSRRRETADYVRRAMLADLLVLDDLGAHPDTDWLLERFAGIIDERWSEDRATIVTTNLSPQRPPAETLDGSDRPLSPLATMIGERTFSRLLGSSSTGTAIIIRLTGADRRLEP